MKFVVLMILITTASFSALAKDASQTTKFTIFSGDKKASFFAAASAICDVFNDHYVKEGYECVALPSKGSEANLYSLANKEADFAVVKPFDLNRIFVQNFATIENKIDFFARIHDEYLTILVQKNLQIKSLNDLNNRVVNIGSIGSVSALVTQKYFSNFDVKPKEIVNLGATKSFEMMCDKKIDAWVYFMGHPNSGFREVLEKCGVELISLPTAEIKNFLKILPVLEEKTLVKELYESLPYNITTISTHTILASRKGVDLEIKNRLQNILENHREELVEKNQLLRRPQ